MRYIFTSDEARMKWPRTTGNFIIGEVLAQIYIYHHNDGIKTKFDSRVPVVYGPCPKINARHLPQEKMFN